MTKSFKEQATRLLTHLPVSAKKTPLIPLLIGATLLFLGFLFLLYFFFVPKKPPTYDDLLPDMQGARIYTEGVADLVNTHDDVETQIGEAAYNGYLGIITEDTPQEVVAYTQAKYQNTLDLNRTFLQDVAEHENAIKSQQGVASLTDLEQLRTGQDLGVAVRPLNPSEKVNANELIAQTLAKMPKGDFNTPTATTGKSVSTHNTVAAVPPSDDHDHDHSHHHHHH